MIFMESLASSKSTKSSNWRDAATRWNLRTRRDQLKMKSPTHLGKISRASIFPNEGSFWQLEHPRRGSGGVARVEVEAEEANPEKQQALL